MSDEEDTPPEALFFTNRAQNFPIRQVSMADYADISKLIEDASKDTKEPEKKTRGKNPAPKGKGGKSRKRLKSVDDYEITLAEDEDTEIPKTEVEIPSEDISTFAPAVKRRLKTIHTRQANELKKIVEQNSKILSAANIPVYHEVEEAIDQSLENISNFILTVSFMSQVSRLKCCKNEKFLSIFPKVAHLFNLKASELLLCLNNYNINLDDTPESLNIALTDIIECLPYKASSSVATKSDDTLKIFFQSESAKEKIHLFVHKLQSMQDIMQKYADLKTVPIESLVFEFDGERIQGSETPLDLDMESGNCIDVKTKNKPVSGLNATNSAPSNSSVEKTISSILSYFVQRQSSNTASASDVDPDVIFIE